MLSREVAAEALDELVAVLQALDQKSTICIVGGAALMLGFGARDATHGIDAVITPRTEIMPFVLDIARRRNLPDDWLNSSAAMYVPAWPDDPGPRVFMLTERVEVSIASTDTLLAMKIHASRGRQDIEDLKFLLAYLGIDTYEGAVAHYERFYVNDPIKNRAMKILTEIFRATALTKEVSGIH